MIMRLQVEFRDGSMLTGPAVETVNGGLAVHGIPVSQDMDLTPGAGVTALRIIPDGGDGSPHPDIPVKAGDLLTCESGNRYRATGREGYHHLVAVNPDTGDETYIPRDRIIRTEHASA